MRECFERALEQCEEEESQLVHQLEDMSLQDVPMAALTQPGEGEDEDGVENGRNWALCHYPYLNFSFEKLFKRCHNVENFAW